MTPPGDVSHIEIYHKLGTLEGKMDALIARTSEYRNDLETAFSRIAAIENKQSWIMGGAIVMSAIIPVLIHLIGSSFHIKVAPTDGKTIASIVRNI